METINQSNGKHIIVLPSSLSSIIKSPPIICFDPVRPWPQHKSKTFSHYLPLSQHHQPITPISLSSVNAKRRRLQNLTKKQKPLLWKYNLSQLQNHRKASTSFASSSSWFHPYLTFWSVSYRGEWNRTTQQKPLYPYLIGIKEKGEKNRKKERNFSNVWNFEVPRWLSRSKWLWL